MDPVPAKHLFYTATANEVLKTLHTKKTGLSEEEARKRIWELGRNRIKKKRNWQWLGLIFSQFNNSFTWILLVAAGLAFAFQEYRDTIIVLIIVLVNAAIGFFQEFKAEKILKKIQRLTTDTAVVIREGEKKEVDSRYIAPGDIIYITAGDRVPADGYLLESYDLYVNDFIFTGESLPHRKTANEITGERLPLGEITNMVFMGSDVTRGEGLFVVTATGMATELGHIAHLTTEVATDETPLQKRMGVLGKEVSVIAIAIGLFVVVAGRSSGASWYEAFLFALALSVSVVPEGLPAALSVALSLGMKRLLKERILAKKLAAVETLGSVSIICTDKTGTMTRNELMVTKIILPNKTLELSGEGFEPKGHFKVDGQRINPKKISSLDTLFKIGVLCNDADIRKDNGRYRIIGDPTEGAILVAAQKYEKKRTIFFEGETKINEIPFSSERMRMNVIYKNSSTISYVKGSPDVIIDLCSHIKNGDNVRPITSQDKKNIRDSYDSMSKNALRVLAFAYRDLCNVSSDRYLAEAEHHLVWVGMMGMIDPPRKDIDRAIQTCLHAGIKVVMITGDYELTAEAIAKQVGLLDIRTKESNEPKELSIVINGRMLDTLSDEQILDQIKRKNVIFARIAPEQKLRIATILKNADMVIAMTGDGVNDALALKKADIGVAMGRIGTDVAKEAGDMILMDDNFSSIVRGVREGRVIHQNIKKFVHYVFTSNASELFTVVIGAILQIPAPLIAIHILATDLGTDVLPSLSLGVDPAQHSVMETKPPNPREKIVTKQGFLRLLYLGIIMAGCAVGAFLWSMVRGGWTWGSAIHTDSILYIKSTSVTYAVIAMTQMANLFQSRSETQSVFKIGFFTNKYVLLSLISSAALLIALMHIAFFQKYLRLSPIDTIDWLVVAASTIAVFTLEEIRKFFIRKKGVTE